MSLYPPLDSTEQRADFGSAVEAFGIRMKSFDWCLFRTVTTCTCCCDKGNPVMPELKSRKYLYSASYSEAGRLCPEKVDEFEYFDCELDDGDRILISKIKSAYTFPCARHRYEALMMLAETVKGTARELRFGPFSSFCEFSLAGPERPQAYMKQQGRHFHNLMIYNVNADSFYGYPTLSRVEIDTFHAFKEALRNTDVAKSWFYGSTCVIWSCFGCCTSCCYYNSHLRPQIEAIRQQIPPDMDIHITENACLGQVKLYLYGHDHSKYGFQDSGVPPMDIPVSGCCCCCSGPTAAQFGSAPSSAVAPHQMNR